MTPEQFWDGDNDLPRDYRQADKMRIDRANQIAWLQGMYFYEALADIAPVMRAFVKNGTRAHPYPTKPFDLDGGKEKKEKKTKKEKYDPGIAYMEMMMANSKQKFRENPE